MGAMDEDGYFQEMVATVLAQYSAKPVKKGVIDVNHFFLW
jgi:hypothetical protein